MLLEYCGGLRKRRVLIEVYDCKEGWQERGGACRRRGTFEDQDADVDREGTRIIWIWRIRGTVEEGVRCALKKRWERGPRGVRENPPGYII